ncbi:MAG: hypothetical protein HQK53_00455 [Oligoflexia bacterium]|nr:hypothetical protein [Oligoflexia bacterium]
MVKTISRICLFLCLCLCLSLLSSITLSVTTFAEPLSTYHVENMADFITNDFEVLGKDSTGYVIVVPKSKKQNFKSLIPHSRLIENDINAYGYNNYDNVLQRIKKVSQENPQIAELTQYGTSPQGKPAYVLTISNKLDTEKKPELIITGSTHGNEGITTEAVLGLIDLLVAGYNNDTRLQRIVNFSKIHFVPVINVDGYVAGERYAEGRDPNREYPYPGLPNRKPVSCIRDIMAFFNTHKIAGVYDFHAYASMTMFPWGYTTQLIPKKDYDEYMNIGSKMVSQNGFELGPIATTIYVAKGGSVDYYYWKQHSISFVTEVSHNFKWTKSEVPQIVEEVRESTWIFIESFL